MADPKVEIYDDKAGEVRFRVIAANGKTVAGAQGYRDGRDALRGVEDLYSTLTKWFESGRRVERIPPE